MLDTSVIIDGEVTKMIQTGDISGASQIIIPLAALDELQSQASSNKEHGFVGLREIKKIREECSKKKRELLFVHARPTLEDIRLARHGRHDAVIRDVAIR